MLHAEIAVPEPIAILTGLGILTIAGDAIKSLAKTGASKAGGFVLKSAYDRLAARIAGHKLPPDDPLTIAVVKAQTEILLGFIGECRSTLVGLDSVAARSERDWLDRKRRELETLRQNAERGAVNTETVQADELRAILHDDGQPNKQLIDSFLVGLTQGQPSDATDCLSSRVRHHFVERFTDVFRTEAAKSESLHRLITQSFQAELPAILVATEDLLAVAEIAGEQRDTLLAELRAIRNLLTQLSGFSSMTPSAPAPRQINTLPSPPADFTGRATELDSLRNYVQNAQQATIAVRGRGGVGKTAIALQLAQELATQVSGPALYVDLLGSAGSPLTPRDAQIRLIQFLSSKPEIPDDDAELAQIYRATLASELGLLVLDDARDLAQIDKLRPPSSWILIVTSRQWFNLDGQCAVNLSEFSPDDARTLLLRATSSDTGPRRLSDDHADTIAMLCGYLPLALRLAASALQNRPGLTVEDYIRRLQGPTGPLHMLDSEADASPGMRGLTATILTSVALLSEFQQNRWTALGIFPADFEGYGAAAVWDMLSKDMSHDLALEARDKAHDSLDELVRFSLVDATPDNGRYRLHLLLRSAAVEKLSPEVREALSERFATFYAWILAETSRRVSDPVHGQASALSLLDVERMNILTGWGWALSQAPDSDPAAQLAVLFASAGAHVVPFSMRSQERIAWYEAAVKIARQINNQAAVADFLTILGSAYKDSGNLDYAIDLHVESWSVASEIPDTNLQMNAAGNLATALATRGGIRLDTKDIQEAIGFQRLVLANARLAGRQIDEARTLLNMGQTYMQVEAAYPALPLIERSLSIAGQIGDHTTEIRALNSLGPIYRTLSRSGGHDEALNVALYYLDQSLSIALQVGDVGAIRVARGNIANLLHDAGQYAEAAQVNLEIAASMDSGTDPPELAQALRNLALSQAAAGQFDSAVAAAEVALPILEAMSDIRAPLLQEDLAKWRTKVQQESVSRSEGNAGP